MNDVRDGVTHARERAASSVAHVALPRFQDLGRDADGTFDRLLGRPVRPSWFKPLVVIGVVGLLATLAAMAMSWSRGRPTRPAEGGALDRVDRMSELRTTDLDMPSSARTSGLQRIGSAMEIETNEIGLIDNQAGVP